MKLLLLLMLALPALSSDSSKNNTKSVLVLNPNLKDRVPKISPMRLMTRNLAPLISLENKEKRSLSPPVKIGNTNLEWQTWTGSLPDGAVSIYNDNTERTDYVCKYRCDAGFYTPEKGPNCFYSHKQKEHPASKFEILVNKENFEFLEWEDDCHGSVPQNSVKTCSGIITAYVEKNKYELGKVDQKQRVFLLPWKKEHKDMCYQVLTYDTEISSEQISDVKYKINDAKINRYPLETMSKSTITNNECSEVKKTVTLSKTSEVAQSWDINFSITGGVKTSISTKIPLLTSAGVELSASATFEYTKGTTRTVSNTHSVEVELDVPPNHSCSVRMVGHKREGNIPFTARISRTYSNGETKWASISGTYKGVQIGDVQAVVDRCEPVPNAKPCPLK